MFLLLNVSDAWWMGTFVVALRYTTIGDATLFGEVHWYVHYFVFPRVKKFASL